MEPILAISDLHPEKGFNEALYGLLWGYSTTHTIIYIGDSLQYPNSYKKVPHIAVFGNHDSDKCSDEYYVFYETVFVHSHQWDPDAETGGIVQDSIWAFFQYLFNSKKFSLGTERIVTLDEMVKWPMDDAEYARVRDKILPAVQAKFGALDKLFMGHRHTRYARRIDNVVAINCGAGWRGEFVTIDDAGVMFHSFK